MLFRSQHFWIYDAREYPWIPRGSALQRNWLPEDLERIHASLGLDGSVAVQARQTLAESHWLLKLADAHTRVSAVVGWVDLQSDAVEEDLAALSRHPRFAGVRHVVQDEPDDDFMLRPAFMRGIGCLRQFRLKYDLLIYPRQLPAAIALVRRFPDQPFVLDHMAKPRIRDRAMSPWREQIRELASHPHVFCKVSGLVTEADHAGWRAGDLQAYFDVVLEAFGPRRLMFGSDWPVCLLASEYGRWLEVLTQWTSGFSPAESEGFWGANCGRFYGIPGF